MEPRIVVSRRYPVKSVLALLIGTVSLFMSLPSVAQDSFDMQRGLTPYGSFKGGDLDSVNMVNGNLIAHIPILSFPQRGKSLRLNYNIYYNDKQYYLNYTMNGLVVTGSWEVFGTLASGNVGHVGAFVNYDQNPRAASGQHNAIGAKYHFGIAGHHDLFGLIHTPAGALERLGGRMQIAGAVIDDGNAHREPPGSGNRPMMSCGSGGGLEKAWPGISRVGGGPPRSTAV